MVNCIKSGREVKEGQKRYVTDIRGSEEVAASGRRDGTLRLVGGDRTPTTNGRVEIYYNNTWGTICDDSWSDNDARVVCRSLGLTTSHTYLAKTRSYFGRGRGTIWLDEVHCVGTEPSLVNCRHNPWGHSDCTHIEDAGVDCNPAAELEDTVRLVDGANSNEGRVEILHNNVWGTVCDDRWSSNAAQTVCRQLNLTRSTGVPVDQNYFTNGTVNPSSQIWLDDVSCRGTELALGACDHKAWGSNDCSHNEDAGVICIPANMTPVGPLPVRLAGGPNRFMGRVEVQAFGHWGTVCDDSFGTADAIVVCRMLGFRGGAQTRNRFLGGRGPIWLDDLRCTGREASIKDCAHKPWGNTNCQHGEDVSILCQALANQTTIVPMIEGNGSLGRLLVTIGTRQGSVCDDYATNAVAMIVCRQLGFNTTNAIVTKVAHPSSSVPVVLDDVRCVGTEDSLAGCRYNLNPNCNHREDLGIDCQAGYSSLQVRLVDRQGNTGPNIHMGRVEVLYNGTWGTVCDDNFRATDAKVICKQLGLNGTTPYALASYGGGTGPIWIDDLGCTGSERNIASCRHSGYGIHDCRHSEDAGVSCQGGSGGGNVLKARLVGGSRTAGRLEVSMDGHAWGTVCDDSFSTRSALVACKMLGFNATSAMVRSSNYFGAGLSSQMILLDEVRCTGREPSLSYCQHNAIGTNDCNHGEDVGIVCLGAGHPAGPLHARLVNGTSTSNGRLEIQYNGTWSTVCDDSFGTPEATVACRMLGFTSPNALVVTSAVYGPGTGNIILDDLQCEGTEPSLAQCGNKGYYNHNCLHREDVGIQCGQQTVLLRLAGRNRTRNDMGRVEIRVGSQWGTVCDDLFDARAAAVVCRYLHYSSRAARVVPAGQFGPGHGRILLDNVRCQGNETNLMDCVHSPVGSNNCDHSEDVGVICTDT
ncbi:hypothetical protein ACOMHN_012546 [Nucella lapillus]